MRSLYRGDMPLETPPRNSALRDVVLPVPEGCWQNENLAAIVGEEDFSLEIADGGLLVKPMPSLLHLLIQRRLADQLRVQCPPGWEPGVEVPIRVLTGRRVADVAVVRATPSTSLDAHNYEPTDVSLVIEVDSPSSRRTDRMLKTEDYEAAGISCYVRINPDPVIAASASVLSAAGYRTIFESHQGS